MAAGSGFEMSPRPSLAPPNPSLQRTGRKRPSAELARYAARDVRYPSCDDRIGQEQTIALGLKPARMFQPSRRAIRPMLKGHGGRRSL